MEEVVIKWYRINPAGQQDHYFTTKLEMATIVSIKASMKNCLDPANGPFGHMEEVSFTYDKIIWTWVPDGIEEEDSWKAPKAAAA
jgi:type VI secretion system secreted protein Hcp